MCLIHREYKLAHRRWVRNVRLALPSYVLPLNLDFAFVLGLAIWYVSQIFQVDFQPANQQTEGVAENDDVDGALVCVVVP